MENKPTPAQMAIERVWLESVENRSIARREFIGHVRDHASRILAATAPEKEGEQVRDLVTRAVSLGLQLEQSIGQLEAEMIREEAGAIVQGALRNEQPAADQNA